jgi:hypothetical protein
MRSRRCGFAFFPISSAWGSAWDRAAIAFSDPLMGLETLLYACFDFILVLVLSCGFQEI